MSKDMDTRKRFRSLPATFPEYTTKKELAQRKSHPICPFVPTKSTKMRPLQQIVTNENSPATAVFFSNEVTLSRLYESHVNVLYLDQVFTDVTILGSGSFGVVFKAKFRENDDFYAIKQMKSSHNIQYGYTEVGNLEKVGCHPNCVKFFMAWEQNKIIHIQMEFCPLSLAQFTSLNDNIDEHQLWEILYDMLKALEYLHAKHFIHLDVKPENIMLSLGFYKLADFGLLVDLNSSETRKTSSISDGDAKYLAAEVLEGVYNYSCDIFGLGISLLEVATNIVLPGYGPLWHEIRKSLPTKFYDAVGRGFSVIIEKMMATDYTKRPAASTVLKYQPLQRVFKQDKKLARTVYNAKGQETPPAVNIFDNNNIVETPKRSIEEREPPKSSKSESRPENNNEGNGSIDRSKISRIKLTF